MLEAIWIGFAFFMGLLVRVLGLPTLVGYLIAGFLVRIVSDQMAIANGADQVLEYIAHLGVLLLLFSIGLKLNIKTIVKKEVFATGLSHFFISSTAFFLASYYLFHLELREALLLAIALSFSSTVLSAKVLDIKSELKSFHGRNAIGILILQDLIALLVISLASSKMPSPWALIVFALPFTRPLLYRFLDSIRSKDLVLLFGLFLALVVGGVGFKSLGLNAELGALFFGVLLSKHKRAGELGQRLWSVKEFFLVGFFLQIGMQGLPTINDWYFAFIMLAILPLKGILFFFLMVGFRLKARNAFLSGLSLTAYSEFGLIVASAVLSDWLVPLALTLALSFIVSAPLNYYSHYLYEKISKYLASWERDCPHPDEQILDLKNAEALIVGMGRTGTAAYQRMKDQLSVIAIDSDPDKIDRHQKKGRNVVYADAEDFVFWQNLRYSNLKAVLLCMDHVEAKYIATTSLRKKGFNGLIVSHCMNEEEAKRIHSLGVDQTYLTMSEAGVSLANFVEKHLA